MDQPQAQNASDAHCFVTKLVTSNSSCDTSEVFHTVVYFQSFLSHWAWKETLPSTLSPWKNVTLNSIYHHKVHASPWNPNTASEAEAKRKGGKKGRENKSLSHSKFWILQHRYFCCYFEYSSMHASVAYFQQIPAVPIKLFCFYYCSADTNWKLAFGLDYITFGHAK